ncbi:MAG: heavy metal translocating P-type ATPase, partial [Arcobacter sp.]
MENLFLKVHETPFRSRYKYDLLKDETLNENLLADYLKKQLPQANNIRINKKAQSIVFEYTSTLTDKIEQCLSSIDKEKLLKESSSSTMLSCVNEEEPSLNGVTRASLALGLERVVKNDMAKATMTTAAALPLLKEGTQELLEEGLTSKVLEAAAVGISIYRKDYLAANSTNAMLELGEYIEETTVHKSDDLLKELAKPNVKEAWVERKVDGKVTEVLIDSDDIKVGDIVVVGMGNTIPIDGHIVEGNASVNQISMTGEAEPVMKVRGDRVISGTIVEDGRIKIWAENVGSDTATQKIKTYIENSLNEKSSVQLKATKLANKLVPVTLGLAGASYLY